MFTFIKTFILVEKDEATIGTDENTSLKMVKLQVFILLNFCSVLNWVFNNNFLKRCYEEARKMRHV